MSFKPLFLTLSLVLSPFAIADKATYKVAVINYAQETCTFCPGGDADIEDRSWRVPYVTGAELIARERGFVGGFVHAANGYKNLSVIGINSPDAVFGGSSRSWETRDSFEHFMTIISDDLKSKMPVDGVYLALHGAMAVRGIPRPEATGSGGAAAETCSIFA